MPCLKKSSGGLKMSPFTDPIKVLFLLCAMTYLNILAFKVCEVFKEYVTIFTSQLDSIAECRLRSRSSEEGFEYLLYHTGNKVLPTSYISPLKLSWPQHFNLGRKKGDHATDVKTVGWSTTDLSWGSTWFLTIPLLLLICHGVKLRKEAFVNTSVGVLKKKDGT